MTLVIAINPGPTPRDAQLRRILTPMTAARAHALDDEALLLAMFGLYRLIRQGSAYDPVRPRLVAAWEVMDGEALTRPRDQMPRLRLR